MVRLYGLVVIADVESEAGLAVAAAGGVFAADDPPGVVPVQATVRVLRATTRHDIIGRTAALDRTDLARRSLRARCIGS